MADDGQEPIKAKCLLRVSARLNKLDRGYTRLESKFIQHAKELGDFISLDSDRHKASEDTMVILRGEINESSRLLHSRINSTLRLFWGLMISVAGFIIVALLGIIAKFAYDGVPWRAKAELITHLFS